jgi:hypothetical protein
MLAHARPLDVVLARGLAWVAGAISPSSLTTTPLRTLARMSAAEYGDLALRQAPRAAICRACLWPSNS